MRGWHYIRELDRLFADAEFWAKWSDRLHPGEKRAIANGEIDVIRRPLEPTWPAEQWIEVTRNLWIKPHEPEWTRGGYRIRFAVRDFRGPHSSSVRGKATRESLDGVTTLVPFARSMGEPERVDPTTEQWITRQAREREQERRAEEHAELFSAMAELRAAIDSMPPDRKRRMSRTLWTLRSRLDSAERELRRREAA